GSELPPVAPRRALVAARRETDRFDVAELRKVLGSETKRVDQHGAGVSPHGMRRADEADRLVMDAPGPDARGDLVDLGRDGFRLGHDGILRRRITRVVPYRKATIRPYRPEDESVLFSLARESFGERPAWSDAQTLTALETDTVFVAELGGAAAGYVAVE